jgi:hypothetical protein
MLGMSETPWRNGVGQFFRSEEQIIAVLQESERLSHHRRVNDKRSTSLTGIRPFTFLR